MKGLNFLVFVFLGFSSGILIAHVKKEEGLFYKYVRYATAHAKKDFVVLINGAHEFNQVVVAQSHQKPVVFKLFSPALENKEKDGFQAVAELLNSDVSFVAMNVFENREVFKQIMATLKLKQVDLPFFLFYKNGELYFPSLQGYLNKEYLENAIKRTFAS